MAIWIPLAALAIGLLAFWPPVAFAGGSLDPAFGGSGFVTTDFGLDDGATDVAIDSENRIIATGLSGAEIAVARYLPTGTLDPSFGGGDGLVTTNFGRLEDFPAGVAIDADDQIVVAASTSSDTSCSDCDFALARFTEAGTLDLSFGGGDGKVITDLGSGDCDYASDLAIDTSGRILVAGTACKEAPPDYADLALARYAESGDLDPSFDGDGIVTTDLDGATQSGRRIVLDGAGRIIVGGETAVGDEFAFAAVRYLETGALDTSFSGDGRMVTEVAPGENSLTSGLAVDASGRIVLGGTVFVGSPNFTSDVVLVRYLASGALDPSFNGDGVVVTSTGAEGGGNSLAIDGSGRLVVAGSQAEQVYSDVALRRYLTDGSLDATFGAGGLVQADLGTASSDSAGGVALDSEGRIVVAGTTGPFGAGDFAVARFLPEGTFVPPPKQPPLEEPSEPPLTGPPSAPSVTSPPAPAATPAPPIARPAKPRRCKRGFKKRKVRGKSKCIKIKRAPHRRRVGRG